MAEQKEVFGVTFTALPPENGLPLRWRNEGGLNRVLVVPPFDSALFPSMPSQPPYDTTSSWSIYVPHQEGKRDIEFGGAWHQLTGDDAEDRAFSSAIGFADQHRG